jgi:hypothetical protein
MTTGYFFEGSTLPSRRIRPYILRSQYDLLESGRCTGKVTECKLPSNYSMVCLTNTDHNQLHWHTYY